MLLNTFKAGAAVLFALCAMPTSAVGDDLVFKHVGVPVYVNLYSTDARADQNLPYNFAFLNILPEMKQIRVVGSAAMLGRRGYAIRIWLSPDRMRAYRVSTDDVKQAFVGCSMVGPTEPLVKEERKEPSEYEFTLLGRFNKLGQYENIILKANPDGEILRLKDVGRVELESSLIDHSSEIDGHPAATLILKPGPGSTAADMLEAVMQKLTPMKKESFPPGMEFQIVPLDREDTVYAVIRNPQGTKLEAAIASCRELSSIAKGIDGIASVDELAGYQIRTEKIDPSVGSCLIHLKNRLELNPNMSPMIETLEKACRTMKVDVEFFTPSSVSVFVAPGGFSIRILDKTSSNRDDPSRKAPEMFLNDLLKRKTLKILFQFLADNYPQDELVIDNDVAAQKEVSIADAIESRFKIVGGNDPSKPKSQRLEENFSQTSFKNDRGEQVPYGSFLQLVLKPGS